MRNLSLDPPTPGARRHRGKTIDDDALPQTLKSPAKMVAMREQRTLEHSRSSSDLKALAENGQSEAEDGRRAGGGREDGSPVKSNVTQRTPPRPPVMRMRRRSTLEWANATPMLRQEKLERVTAERMADVFFSLHVEGVEGW